jgi:hypothetical protein
MISHLQPNAVEFLELLCIWKIPCLKWCADWLFWWIFPRIPLLNLPVQMLGK